MLRHLVFLWGQTVVIEVNLLSGVFFHFLEAFHHQKSSFIQRVERKRRERTWPSCECWIHWELTLFYMYTCFVPLLANVSLGLQQSHVAVWTAWVTQINMNDPCFAVVSPLTCDHLTWLRHKCSQAFYLSEVLYVLVSLVDFPIPTYWNTSLTWPNFWIWYMYVHRYIQFSTFKCRFLQVISQTRAKVLGFIDSVCL